MKKNINRTKTDQTITLMNIEYMFFLQAYEISESGSVMLSSFRF